MPLTRDEFDAGGESAAPVLEFLRSRADQAFTFGELYHDLSGTDVTLDDLDYALSQLVENGVIEAAMVERKVYYMYRARGD